MSASTSTPTSAPTNAPADSPRRRLGVVRTLAFAAVAGALLLVGLGELALLLRNQSLAEQAEAARRGAFTDPDATKILFLGDSWTAGREGESTGEGYWYYVPDALAAAGYEGAVQTATVALAGSTSWFQYEQLGAFLAESELAPDYVMVVTGANDPRSYEQARQFCKEHDDWVELPPFARLWVCGPRGLAFVHGLGAKAAARARGELAPLDVPPGLGGVADEYGAWFRDSIGRPYQATLLRIEEAGAQALIGSYHHDDTDPIRAGIAAAAGVPFHDISTDLVRATLREGLQVEDGWHTNEAGDRYLAELFAAWFVEEVAP